MQTKIENEITEVLDSILYYKGRGANNGVWESWEGDEESSSFSDILVPHSWKTAGRIRIFYYINEYPQDYQGHEIRIEMRLLSYSDWDTVFEGWVKSSNQLRTILECVGVPQYSWQTTKPDSRLNTRPTFELSAIDPTGEDFYYVIDGVGITSPFPTRKFYARSAEEAMLFLKGTDFTKYKLTEVKNDTRTF